MLNGVIACALILPLFANFSFQFQIETKEISNDKLILECKSFKGDITSYEINQITFSSTSSTLEIPLNSLDDNFYVTIISQNGYGKFQICNSYSKTHVYDIKETFYLGYYLKSLMVNTYVINTLSETIDFSFPSNNNLNSLMVISPLLLGEIKYAGKELIRGNLILYPDKFSQVYSYSYNLDIFKMDNIYKFTLKDGYEYKENGEFIYDGKGKEKDIILPFAKDLSSLNMELKIMIKSITFHFFITLNKESNKKVVYSVSEDKKIEDYEKTITY